MGVFITVISKNKTPVTKLITAKLNSGEFETNINTDYDELNVYNNKQDTICIVNFVTANAVYKAEETYFKSSEDEGYACIQGDAILRNTELADMDFLSAKEAYDIIASNDFKTFKSKVSGSYSLIYTDGDHLTAGNDSIGIEHIYYAQTDEHIFISNRIRFIRLFLENQAHTDLITLSNIALMGSVIGVDTSISEVKKIPQGSYITVSGGNFELHKNDLFFYNNPEVSEECKRDFTGFIKKELNVCTNKIVAALNNVENFSLGLSGGKDSRAMLAMLFQIRNKKDIRVFTNGYNEHPDVVVARMIAEHYGLQHTVNEPKKPEALSDTEILKKLMGLVFQTDGMIGLFDAKGNRFSEPYKLALPGHINELCRYHTKESVSINSLEDVIKYYKKINLYDPLNIMRPTLLEEFQKKFTQRAEYYASSGMSFEDLNETYFICDRVPNWVGYLMRTDGYALTQIQAVNNDRLVQAFWREGCTDMRRAELLHFITMKEFGDQWLAECPFANQQWSPYLTPYAEGVNITTAAIPMPKGLPQFGTWQHKISESSEFKVKLLDIFMSFPDSEIWELFDKDRVIRSLMSAKLSYIPLISIYGFINMFFFYHNIEIPTKIKSDRRKIKTPHDVIRLSEGATISEYDNKDLNSFDDYKSLQESGLVNRYRFTISSKAYEIMNISEANNDENREKIINELKSENKRLRETINEIKSSKSFILARRLSAMGDKVKPIKKLAKRLIK